MNKPRGFAELLRRYRLAAELTQEGLADKSGLSVRGIADLERGTRRFPYTHTVRLLSESLGLTSSQSDALLAVARRPARRQGPSNKRSGATWQPLTATVRHNLPIPLSRLIGRDQALAEVTGRLAGARLVTLTGVGGCGKTRLALEVARGVLERFPDGVWLVELGPLADPGLLPQRVGAVLGVREAADQTLTSKLASAVGSRRVLLVLDNCEHLLQACAELVDAVLRACPELRILATSREPIGVDGEVGWRVPSLPVPDARPLASGADMEQNAAVQLFMERARAAQPRFALTVRNAAAVAQLCRRLDGLPLALELAAARVEALTAEQLAERLDQRFRLLTGGNRMALPRQQTLAATLDWSYELLRRPERRLFERLAILAGDWALEAAEAVGAGGGLAAEDVLDLVVRLVRKSLVVAEEQADGTERYRLLETVREYARQRLAARGTAEAAAVRERHAVHYSALADQLGRLAQARPAGDSTGDSVEPVLDRVAFAHDNLRAALGCWLEQGRPVEGLGLAVALGYFWTVRGLYAEGRRWLEDMLELADRTACSSGLSAVDARSVPVVMRARALSWAGLLASRQGEYTQARASHAASVPLWRELGRVAELADDLGFLGLDQWLAGDVERATAALEESLRLSRANGLRGGTAMNLRIFGMIARCQAQYERAAALFREAVAESEAQPLGVYWRAYNVARGAANLGRVACLQGDWPQARAAFREALGVIRETRLAGHTLADLLDWLAGLEGAHGRPARAARLFGAAEALWQASGAARYAPEQPAYERDLAAVRGVLDEERFAAAWTAGQELSWEQAVALAESALAQETAAPTGLPAGREAAGRLTPRQLEVAALVARGLTNRQIAERLTVTERAVAAHVEHILDKLGVGSRVQIAVWASEHGLLATHAN